MNNIDEFKKFLVENIHNFEVSGKRNPFSVETEFQVTPREYLRFAEDELNRNTPVSLINCVSHLKRALDCQLDTFFEVYNLRALFKKRNIKIEKKLQFVGAIGFFNSRSLVRLNNIRNKMEHHYSIPDIEDIEVYFDLITAIVQLLELGTFDAAGCDFDCYEVESGVADLKIEYVRETTEIIITGNELSSSKFQFAVKAAGNIDDFAFFFRVLRQLNLLWDKQCEDYEYTLRELGLNT
ncbi:hypothetical protein QNS37_004455 [Vibrio parahaemolyticus]|nr:hypothetical protein [Vibrio parahaemolyticus]EJG1679155.1 hypothetical protein [Vibrio parahaemolyticus]EJG1721832.1 hypothetical protein [Vibrio parahaemolyticus]EJG1763404.1 hypothetical protein [Vibrio parahaemolyticus]ELB2017017.1 hypothetical protein [Vibrio parahaemolyticus]